MNSSTASASPSIRPNGAGKSHLGACRASVETLQRLLDILFPNAQNPDILTVKDVIRRYPLTQLGAPAAAAMEQSRRILRARRDYRQIGLGEFHTGLIYLYWGDSRAAAQQFSTARGQWSLSSDAPAGCLAYFAQGLALQHGYHFEAAMTQFGWTERCLSRQQVGAQAAQLAQLGDELWPLLDEARQAVRPQLWPKEEGPEASPSLSTPPPTPHVDEPTAESVVSPVAEPEPDSIPDGPPVPLPISNLSRTHPAHPAGPVPGHTPTDDRYTWYVVHKRRDALLPDITEGTWVLVDSESAPWEEGAGQELVVIAGEQPDIGSVMVRPRTTTLAQRPYCYLGFRNPATNGAADRELILDDSGHALTVPNMLLMGIVVGFWHSVIT
ncbi:MAG: hypothetical protein R3C44_01275 [Chloroflexota bacterium]